MTTEELDQVLDEYVEGGLDEASEQELSDHVTECEDRDYSISGTVISENLIPDFDPNLSCHVSQYLDESRVKELGDGAEPIAEELELFRAAWLHWAGHSGEGDADVIPGFVAVALKHSDGRLFYGLLLIRGYSFTGIQEDFHGVFRSRDDLLSYVRGLGQIGEEIPDPPKDLIGRAQACSRGKAPIQGNPHPIESLPAPEFEDQYLRNFGGWDRLTYSQLEILLTRALLHYGLADDTSLIPAMAHLMRRAVRDLSPERRAAVYQRVCQTLERHKSPAFYAFIPVLVHETHAQVVATATIDFVSMSPTLPDGVPACFREAVGLVRNGTPTSSGGVFGGLVSLGDERFTPDLESLKAYLSPSDIQAAARCDSGFASDAQIRFWLEWAEKLMPLAGDADIDSIIGSVASALALIRKRVLTPIVFQCERRFPAQLYDSPSKVIDSWAIDEYARMIAPRLYALEAEEPPPKVFSSVLEIWGLPPKARRAERLSQPLIC